MSNCTTHAEARLLVSIHTHSSTNGYAFEAQEDSKRNSYFVTEIIRSLNESNPHQKEKIDIFLNKVIILSSHSLLKVIL